MDKNTQQGGKTSLFFEFRLLIDFLINLFLT